MTTIADYQVLYAGGQVLAPNTDHSSVVMRWDPPPDFVAGTNKARPLLTWQLVPTKTSEYNVLFWPDDRATLGPHVRTGVEPGQVHTGSMTLDGPDLLNSGRFRFTAGYPGEFRLELVTIWYQRKIK